MMLTLTVVTKLPILAIRSWHSMAAQEDFEFPTKVDIGKIVACLLAYHMDLIHKGSTSCRRACVCRHFQIVDLVVTNGGTICLTLMY